MCNFSFSSNFHFQVRVRATIKFKWLSLSPVFAVAAAKNKKHCASYSILLFGLFYLPHAYKHHLPKRSRSARHCTATPIPFVYRTNLPRESFSFFFILVGIHHAAINMQRLSVATAAAAAPSSQSNFSFFFSPNTNITRMTKYLTFFLSKEKKNARRLQCGTLSICRDTVKCRQHDDDNVERHCLIRCKLNYIMLIGLIVRYVRLLSIKHVPSMQTHFRKLRRARHSNWTTNAQNMENDWRKELCVLRSHLCRSSEHDMCVVRLRDASIYGNRSLWEITT